MALGAKPWLHRFGLSWHKHTSTINKIDVQNRFSSKSLFFKWLFMTCHRQYIMHQLMLCTVQLMQVCPKPWAIRTPNFLYLPTSTYTPLHSYSHLFTYRAFLGLHPCHWRTVKEQQRGSCIFRNLERTKLFVLAASQKLEACSLLNLHIRKNAGFFNVNFMYIYMYMSCIWYIYISYTHNMYIIHVYIYICMHTCIDILERILYTFTSFYINI